jgi:glycosyltransferase involved in cell wall biosynthesis
MAANIGIPNSTKILFYQNNEKFLGLKLYQEGKYFGHTFYGATHLPKYGCDVEIMVNPQPQKIDKFLKKFKIKLSVLRHTAAIIKNARAINADAIYVPYPSGIALLAFLRIMGLYKKKLVVIIHNISTNGILRSILFKGIDQIICISKATYNNVPEKYKAKTQYLEWGPDLDFYNSKNDEIGAPQFNYFISTGKADRDFDTLLKALQISDVPAVIYLPQDNTFEPGPENKNLIIKRWFGKLLHPVDFLKEYNDSLGFVIPTKNNHKLLGLTSLFEGMAMKKPVIMTYNSYIDFDIEKEGIGLWADINSVESWVKALKYIHENPDKAREMGQKGYELCLNKYNLELFTENLANVIQRVVNKDK